LPCRSSSRNLEFSVYFLPNKSGVCEKLFQEAGISANVSLGEFPLYFIPFDYDLLSLELDATFRVTSQPCSAVKDACGGQ
jgi:hypothetical protein